MSYLIQYRPLFAIQWLHEYYLPQDPTLFQGVANDVRDAILARQRQDYRVSNDFEIAPAIDCEEILRDLGLLFKKNNTGFFVAARVNALPDGTFVPFAPFSQPFSLRFSVSMQNQRVASLTNLPLADNVATNERFVYYLSNRAGNVSSAGTLYLTKPLVPFDAGLLYEAGDIITDITDPLNPVILEAIENNGPGAFDSNQWQQLYADVDPLPQFMSKADRIVLKPAVFKHDVETAAQEDLNIVVSDMEGSAVKILSFSSSEAGTPLSICELNLGDLPPAYYRLEVRDTTGTSFPDLNFDFFMDDKLYLQRPFAIIECFHEPAGSLNEYRWLDQDNDNRLLAPQYMVNLKNRSTYWRYYYPEAPVFTSSDVEVFESPPGNPLDRILISNQPLGLTRIARRLEIDIGGDILLLPNPAGPSVFPEDGKIYSELNMGGGLGPPL